jgi:hypothetical protein
MALHAGVIDADGARPPSPLQWGLREQDGYARRTLSGSTVPLSTPVSDRRHAEETKCWPIGQ